MSRGAGRTSPFLIFGLAGLVIVGAGVALALEWTMPAWVGAVAGINLATVALYGYDKRAASTNRLRVPENVLHLAALLGGSPAALLSQRMFRHKTSKTSFRIWFWLIVVVQLAAIAAALWAWRHPAFWRTA
jgi:uncharacterized membrane protein YsdA (DUF1294 family)